MQGRAAAGTLRAAASDAVDAVVSFLPRLLGFLLVLGVGWLLSSLVARGVRAVLQAAGFDELARRSGVATIAERLGARADPTEMVTVLAQWAVRLIALVSARFWRGCARLPEPRSLAPVCARGAVAPLQG